MTAVMSHNRNLRLLAYRNLVLIALQGFASGELLGFPTLSRTNYADDINTEPSV